MKKRWPRATAPAATVWDNKKQRDASQASRLSASKKYDLDCLHWEQVVKNLSESPKGVFDSLNGTPAGRPVFCP